MLESEPKNSTIKVGSVIRDWMAHLVRARGIMMGALLSDVVERLETERRRSDIEAAYARMQRHLADRAPTSHGFISPRSIR